MRGIALPIVRIALVWLVATATLLLLSAIFPDIQVEDFGTALLAAALIGLVNAFVWPLLIRIALPFTVLTLGLGVVVLNGAMVLLVSAIEPGLEVSTLLAGIAVALGLTIATTAATSLLAIDDDEFWYRNVIQRQVRRTAKPEATDVPGLFFLEIDGLAHAVLLRALRDGNAPTMARWVRDGSYRLTRWETDWSSQTGACQAGLLHGNNDDMPAFRWWEKERGKAIVTNHPRDAMELERRHSDGRGLLFSDGTSRANILSGDAPHSLLTMSTAIRRDRAGRIGQDYFAYFANPYNLMRTLALVARELASERWSAIQQRRRDVQPRIHRSLVYSLMRAWATIIQRDLQVAAVIADMYAGLPVAYTTFLAYDEVAHHSGIERPDALATLREVDRQIGRIAAARRHAPRPYRLVVLSDHGQSQGAPFLDRYGVTLEALVREAADASAASADGHPDEALGFLGASLTEASNGDSRLARVVRRTSRRRIVDGAVQLGHDGRAPADGEQPPEIVAVASGCLGLVSFPREAGRLTLEDLEARYPRVVPALRDHPGVGFVLVRSEAHGALAIGAKGINYLDAERIEGEDPLAPFGPHAARHLRREAEFANVPDILVISRVDPVTGEVPAFEELVGNHGGLGGSQREPFLLYPAVFDPGVEEIVGAGHLHGVLKSWIEQEQGKRRFQDLKSRSRDVEA